MKTKKRVARNTTRKSPGAQGSEFPGYPLYAAADDITNRSERVDADLEQPKGAPQIESFSPSPSIDNEAEEEEIEGRTKDKDDSDVTFEDLEALGSLSLESDMGDDEDLKHRSTPVDFSGKDLDVPGSEDDDQQESVGSEDEENNSYSIGGDDHNDLEEDKGGVR